jgi:hypothetical protein
MRALLTTSFTLLDQYRAPAAAAALEGGHGHRANRGPIADPRGVNSAADLAAGNSHTRLTPRTSRPFFNFLPKISGDLE